MYSRIIKPPKNKSFFLFGPRGTGKTTWLKSSFPKAIYLDLLEAELFNDLLANPQRLENFIPNNFKDWVILDEAQRVPALLNEAHRLIEKRKIKFILTGSSARKLKQKDVNLLAGRALTYHFYPLTSLELKEDFSLEQSLQFGSLPATLSESDKKKYLESYVSTYLREEIQQEGLTRNLGAFSRFLETASFFQGQVLNMSEIARECACHRKVVENYFSILQDMMIGDFLYVFSKKAKRRLILHPKFYFFDTGVYRTLRPTDPLD
ncbi:ATP-binding protein, partial [Candidatus Gribaldobacteria bacterium]|nr:ATP-binding protein [Candidatus Gribaldobacteria bacterium]